ncbi:MAG: hypothetical protein JSR76_05555 [Verrucomicrobia bacterium]|nr:hypothetical protein [Verrucomicrobiota bacterium]
MEVKTVSFLPDIRRDAERHGFSIAGWIREVARLYFTQIIHRKMDGVKEEPKAKRNLPGFSNRLIGRPLSLNTLLPRQEKRTSR